MRTLSYPLLALSLLALSAPLRAAVVEDWGTVVTPLSSEATFSFAQFDITNNFTDQYAFSLEGESGASYSVTFAFATCSNGCGNPDLSYGIYDANGGLVATTDGSSNVTLTAGDYVFQVKGDGMGSGNSVDYWGSVSFTAVALASTEVVSPVPEPAQLWLFLPGLLLAWLGRARSVRQPKRSASISPPTPLSARGAA
jgi:hypothetical protein